MKNCFLFVVLVLALSGITSAQYISEVLDYRPAPGQLINTSPWGFPSGAASIVGGINGTLCLGGFGGYVVFQFESPVDNHPDNPFGIDFSIFGNPQQNWAEPGIVMVMKDENQNGIPDDTWYELAGSDYWFSSTRQHCEVTYENPGGDEATDVPWSDNLGNTGFVFANPVHTQTYYPLQDSFPSVDPENYMLSGTLITQFADTSNPGFIQSPQRAFGYADNYPRGTGPYTIPDNPYTIERENSGGDAFDISWAVNEAGSYVDLDEIHFVKVHTAVNAGAGWLGELSTEITGAVDVEPNSSLTGRQHLIVIRELPAVITGHHFQLEVFAFYRGRLMPEAQISWQINMPDASVDQNNLLTVNTSGELILTASLDSHPEISSTVTTLIDLSSASVYHDETQTKISIYPNPAGEHIFITGVEVADIEIMDCNGQQVFRETGLGSPNRVDISGLKSGMYMLRIWDVESPRVLKFIKY